MRDLFLQYAQKCLRLSPLQNRPKSVLTSKEMGIYEISTTVFSFWGSELNFELSNKAILIIFYKQNPFDLLKECPV